MSEDAAAQDELAIHFFTIVLNGEPFIEYHLDMMRRLPFRWHWHVVEGVAALVHDTAWSLGYGGRIAPEMHREGRSVDGTSAYLERIAAEEPQSVTLYRKPPGAFWDGKREMVAAPLANIAEPCLLWQIDADELWLPGQIEAMRQRFIAEPQRSAAFYWCDYFVGPQAVVATRYNYANNPAMEWLRTWRYAPGARWAAHEPPVLMAALPQGGEADLARIAPFSQDESEAAGARFQHFAYATEAQLRFKESYYGYKDALARWRKLQAALGRSIFLGRYFPWVRDMALADTAARAGVAPLARLEAGEWRFGPDTKRARPVRPQIVLDGLLTPSSPPAVREFWLALLPQWLASGFAEQVVMLDRGGITLRVEAFRYRSVPESADAGLLQRICDELDADLFLSARGTWPDRTKTALIHGIAPAVGTELPPDIARAAAHLVLAETARQDLLRRRPDINPALVAVVPAQGLEAALRALCR